MTDDRRWRVPGGCYFFTVNLASAVGWINVARRKNNALQVQHIGLLRDARS